MGISWKNSALGRELNGPLLTVSLYSSVAAMGWGYGATQFIKDFGVRDESGTYMIPASWQSAASGVPLAGVIIGCGIAALTEKHYGRCKTFLVAGMIAIIGVLIQSVSFGSYWQIMVGRTINGMSMGIICNVVPTYQSEVAPPSIRGSMVNMYQFFLLVGCVMAATASWGLHARTDQWAYRTIIILQFIIPALMIAGGLLLPESPRWLIRTGKLDQARKNLTYLRKGTAPEIIEEELRLLEQATNESAEASRSVGWLDLFRGSNLRRTLIAVGVQSLQGVQGNGYMNAYAILFLEALGTANTYELNVLLVFTNCMASAFAFYFVDKIGRRPLMITGALILTICMFAIGAITGYDNSEAGQKGVLCALFVWEFVQAITWASCVWIVTTEVPATGLREKTVTLASFSGFAVGLIVTFVSPYLQDAGYANLQGRIGFVWGAGALISAVWSFFMLPELKGRGLEEINELFENRVSAFRFKDYQTVGAGSQLAQLEKTAGHGDFINGVKTDPQVETIDVEINGKEMV